MGVVGIVTPTMAKMITMMIFDRTACYGSTVSPVPVQESPHGHGHYQRLYPTVYKVDDTNRKCPNKSQVIHMCHHSAGYNTNYPDKINEIQ